MIETTILKYLSDNLADIPVMMEYPEDKQVPCIFLEKTGSGEQNRVLSATIAIQSLDKSLQRAAELNDKVKNVMCSMADDLAGIGRVRLNSDYNFTDQSAKAYRYQAVYEITYVEY